LLQVLRALDGEKATHHTVDLRVGGRQKLPMSSRTWRRIASL
jgi:hypothetical protein